MTEPKPVPAAPSAEGTHAGALLRAARQQQGLHIAALAASIKVSPAKLEALEAGRYDELPDATFTRALALTVCRVLKIDPAPVLAQMPGARDIGLARVDGGLNTPFRDRPGHADPAEWAPWRRPVLWLVGALLLAAAAFVLVPSTPRPQASLPAVDAPADAAATAVMPPGASAPVLPEAAPAAGASAALASPQSAAASAPAAATASAPAQLSASTAGDALLLRANQATWVQAVDGAGQTLMARLVPAGETVELTATPPLRLRIGNAQGTELQFRGQPVDLTAAARDNIANITLP